MEKAYDIKELGAKLKANGLDIAEEAAEVIVKSVFEWVEESAIVSPFPYDDFLTIVLPKLKELSLKQVDKIDNEVG